MMLVIMVFPTRLLKGKIRNSNEPQHQLNHNRVHNHSFPNVFQRVGGLYSVQQHMIGSVTSEQNVSRHCEKGGLPLLRYK